MLQKICKIALISTSSLLLSCAGSAPKPERPIKLWNGTPERLAVCRTTLNKAEAFAKKHLRSDFSKSNVRRALMSALAPDGVECVSSDDPRFAAFLALTADDLGVILRYQENLLYSCERWKQ